MTHPIYTIPDVHGQDALLEAALTLIEADGGPDAEIIFLGDLVDRGPDSRAVIDRVMQGQTAGRNWTVLRGNHDQMFIDFIESGDIHPARLRPDLSWLHPRLGGDTTLASYGVVCSEADPNLEGARAVVPAAHIDWLSNLPLTHLVGDLLFVHAGILPGVPLEKQDPDDLMWIRDGFLDYEGEYPWLLVHGHTALDMPTHFGNRIDLDGGAGRGRGLWPAVFEGRDCWLLSDTGRIPLKPAE